MANHTGDTGEPPVRIMPAMPHAHFASAPVDHRHAAAIRQRTRDAKARSRKLRRYPGRQNTPMPATIAPQLASL
jgi:hypothetical protein